MSAGNVLDATASVAARAFCRSFNILLKYVRLYGFGHKRTVEQFEITLKELNSSIDGSRNGLLLGQADGKLLVNGAACETSPAEQSLMQTLAAAGVSSIHFQNSIQAEELAALARAIAISKAADLVERLEKEPALGENIVINSIKYIAEDPTATRTQNAALLAADALGQAAQLESAMQDPEKLLQLIVAAEGMGKASKASSLAALVECVRSLRSASTGEGEGADGGAGAGSGTGGAGQGQAAEQVVVKDLVNEISEELKRHKGKPSLADLIHIAEHAAIRLAMERFKRGDVKVNAVQRMMERMGKQIDALRKMLFEHEKQMERAGLTVESHASILDRQFWAELPEKAKLDVLLSPDAHCIPSRNIRSFVQQLNERGDQKTAIAILRNYIGILPSADVEAIRKVSTGVSELADVLAKAGVLGEAIHHVSEQLAQGNDFSIEAAVAATFVRLSQEASSARAFEAFGQSLDGMQKLADKTAAVLGEIRPRIVIEDHFRNFVREAVSAPELPHELMPVLQRSPVLAARALTAQLEACKKIAESERIAALVEGVGEAVIGEFRNMLRSGSPADVALAAGPLSRIEPDELVRELLPKFAGWQKGMQARLVAQIAAAHGKRRGELFCALLDKVDDVLVPQVLDFVGYSDAGFDTRELIALTGDDEIEPFFRVKAVEALHRLRDHAAVGALTELATARKVLGWKYPHELRFSAARAVLEMSPGMGQDRALVNGFTTQELSAPLLETSRGEWIRNRRYPRIPMASELVGTLETQRGVCRIVVNTVSLGGFLARKQNSGQIGGEGLLELQLGRWRKVVSEVIVQQLPQGQIALEITNMDLTHRTALREAIAEYLSKNPGLLVRSAEPAPAV